MVAGARRNGGMRRDNGEAWWLKDRDNVPKPTVVIVTQPSKSLNSTL